MQVVIDARGEEPEEGMPVGDHDPRASPYMIHTYFDPQGPRNVSRTQDTAITFCFDELTAHLVGWQNHRPHPTIREEIWPGRFEKHPMPPIETMRLG